MREPGFSYSFNPEACLKCEGRCCSGDSGYIWVNLQEMEMISAELGMNLIDFMQKYLNRVDNRWSLKESRKGSQSICIFYAGGSRRCSIYSARPAQCRSFPFWEYYRTRPEELPAECPGVQLDR